MLKKFLFSPNSLLPFFLLSFILWIYSFWGFLSSGLYLVGDASSFYEHFHFFIEVIRTGVYPLWEPTRNMGVPIELFARRIGSYNPFIYIILLFRSLGMLQQTSYFIFLTFYHFLGLVGFYLVAKAITNNKITAFCAYLLLMFSTFSALLFNSFIILIFVPIIWFFYFLLSFLRQGQQFFFFGMTFCLMLLASTYIPFYFLLILLVIIILYSIIYFSSLKDHLKKIFQFFNSNKIFVALCIALVLISAVPGYLFWKDAGSGGIALPQRHFNTTEENVTTVAAQTTAQGGIIIFHYYDEIFSNLNKFTISRVYVPYFAHLLFLAGFIVRLNRKMILLILLGLIFYLMGVYGGAPIYKFLYSHIFFFKYIRNFQFYLWLVLIPVYILIGSLHLNQLINLEGNTLNHRRTKIAALLSIHFLFAIFILNQKGIIITSILIIGLSALFFIAPLIFKKRIDKRGMMLLLFLAIVLQPLEIFHYLQQNAKKTSTPVPYRYSFNTPFLNLKLPYESLRKSREAEQERIRDVDIPKVVIQEKKAVHMATPWYVFLFRNLNSEIFRKYTHYSKISIYDRVELVEDEMKELEKIGRSFYKNENVAYVSLPKTGVKESIDMMQERLAPFINAQSSGINRFGQFVYKSTKEVQLVDYTVNSITLKTKFNEDKFLVYNDSYHPKWKAFINDKPTNLYRANVAFKGVVIPRGENILTMRFGEPLRYIFNFLLIGVFALVLISLLTMAYYQREKLFNLEEDDKK